MSLNIPEDVAVLLNEIAERLWSGHASVMVGAGFSKNAIRNSTMSKPFLSWNELADVFYERLHSGRPNPTDHYLNPLKLADEVCAAFGRPALEKLMQVSLPDLDYSPSELHRDLLELPWNDVFTTNYDTLLERTKVSQRYDIVLNKNDLVFSQRPRIVKLHGSFPSHRPFVITEEDYRKYPRDNAPLVNTVQQSLIENTLCLIGFSGDDPNFLSWIGWIRDNLGISTSPKIYLIGVLNLSSSQIKVLEQRNIGVIDLSSCVKNDAEKYKAGLQLFIDFLKRKKAEENRLDWPSKEAVQHSSSKELSVVEYVASVKETINVWKKTRSEYPGWVVCPYDSRKTLWQHTSSWIYGRHQRTIFPFGVDITFWWELAWRLETALSPLYDGTVEVIEKVIFRYNPFPELTSVPAEFIKEDNSDVRGWDEITDAWLNLNLSLLRFYREEGLPDKWKQCSDLLEICLERLSAKQKDNLRYEQCLFPLFRQEVVTFYKRLQAWKPDESSSFYQAKKAGLLAEYGDVGEAKSLLESALQFVRSQLNLRPITIDYTYLSEEAYILQLLRFVKDASVISFLTNDDDNRKYIEEFGLRWTKLKQYKCDPWGELKLFEAKLSNPAKEKKSTEIVYGFDVGHSSTTHYLGDDQQALVAYSFLRYMDDIGIPYHIKNMTFGKEPAIGAIKRIAKTSLNWAIATMLRTGDSKAVESIFDRLTLSGSSVEKVDTLVDVLLQMLADLEEDIARGDGWDSRNMGTHYSSIVPEILSRLCTRCSYDRLEKILKFLRMIYNSPHKQKYSNIDKLAERMVRSWPSEKLPELISFVAAEFPVIPSNIRIKSDFPDLLDLVDEEEFLEKYERVVVSPSLIDRLLEEFGSAKGDNRELYVRRLVRFYKYGLLSDNQSEKFGALLWKDTDTFGFPSGLGSFYRWFFTEVPAPQTVKINDLLLNYLQNLKFPHDGKAKSIAITGGRSQPCSELIHASRLLFEIGWTENDALELLKKIETWWHSDKNFLNSTEKFNFSEKGKEYRGRFELAAVTLAKTVIPFLSDHALQENNERMDSLISEMESYGVTVIELRGALFLKVPQNFIGLLRGIEASVLSDDFKKAIKGFVTVVNLLNPKNNHAFNEQDRKKLLAFLVDAIKWRKSNALISALANLKTIVEFQVDISEDQLSDVLIGLGHIARESDLSYEDGQIPMHERLFVRQEAVALAQVLYQLYLKKGVDLPNELEAWKTIAANPQEFAEIRNQWNK